MLTVGEAMRWRRSTRSFERKPVPDEHISEMPEAARLAPSGSNSQPWRFVVVTDENEKRELRCLCFGQAFVEEAGVVLVLCADLSSYSAGTYRKRREEAVDAGVFPAASLNDPAYRRRVESTNQPDPATYTTAATANAYIAGEHVVPMAAALGLGSCWVGAIRLLGIPEEILVLGLVAVGYTAKEPPRRPHLSLDEMLLRPFPAQDGA